MSYPTRPNYSMKELNYAKLALAEVKSGKVDATQRLNISDVEALMVKNEEDDLPVDINKVLEVLEAKRVKQYDLRREISVLYEVL